MGQERVFWSSEQLVGNFHHCGVTLLPFTADFHYENLN